MNLKKILAVGVVVGVAGMASAQLAQPNELIGSKERKGQVELSYEVESIAEMQVVTEFPANIKNEGLKFGDGVGTSVLANNTYGTAATINIECNYAKWDVYLEFENGGFLTKTVGATGPIGGGGTKLKINGATPLTTSNLPVKVFLRNMGAGAAIAGSALTSGNYGGVYFGKLLGNATAFDATASTDVNTGIVYGSTTQTNAVAGVTQFQGMHSASVSNGFGPTPATTVTGTSPNYGAKFTVMAGFPASADLKSGNEDGIYTETLKFTMMANY